MSIKIPCVCGHTVSVPDTAAGRNARCSQCGAVVKVPAADDPEAVAAANVSPSTAPAPAPSSSAAGPATPLEPWYYGVLEFFAWVWLVIGGIQFLVAVVVLFQSLPVSGTPDPSIDRDAPPPPTPAWPLFFASFVALLGAVLSAGFVLLAVDAARTLRALRYRRGSSRGHPRRGRRPGRSTKS